VGTIFTRGVLIGVAGLKGVPTLPDTYEITVADLGAALSRQNVRIEEGDAVIIHTGWGLLWGRENARFVASCPGIGVAAAEWILRQNPMLMGSDNWPVECSPSKTMPDASLPVHQLALVVHGVHLLENMKLDVLARRDGLDRRAFRAVLGRVPAPRAAGGFPQPPAAGCCVRPLPATALPPEA
jgi:kynurenine formamidase